MKKTRHGLAVPVAKILGILCLAGALGGVEALWADSLYPSGPTPSLYGKVKARRVGDVVTILIVESARAEQEASTRTEKDSMNAIGAGRGLFASTATLPVAKWGVGSNRFYEGRGLSRRRGMFKATMTAKITKLLPNGNMVIKGFRYLELNDEIQSMELDGEIRPQDISEENSVLSSAVANARIRYRGKGPLSETSRPGFLVRILDWLWIF